MMEEITEKKSMKGAKWYALRVVSGKEKKVVERLKVDLEIENCDRFVNDILLPIEDEVKIRNGKKVKRSKITIPGYLFIECKIIGEMETVVKHAKYVVDWTRNSDGDTQALRQNEIDRIIGRVEESKKGPIPYCVGEEIMIIDGPFNKFKGIIDTIDEAKENLKVNVMVFGRPSPVELSFLQVERLK